MSGTFINQRQLDEIDACMSYMETADKQVQRFCEAIEVGQWNYGLTYPPVSELRAGSRQATLWKLKSCAGVYRHVHKLLEEIATFAGYLTAKINSLPRVDKKLPVSSLSRMEPPPGPAPAYASASMSDCLQVLKYHQQWLWALAEVRKTAHPGYDVIRETIHKTLPRVMSFMSFHLLAADTKIPPSRLGVARGQEDDVRHHYLLGMGAISNFLTQTQRITTLLNQASQRFGDLESVETVSRLKTEINLIMVELSQAQRYCNEIVALRTVP